jgi:hypothetical protein
VKLYQLQDWRRGRVQSDLAPRTLFRLVAATKSALAQTGGNSLQDQTEKKSGRVYSRERSFELRVFCNIVIQGARFARVSGRAASYGLRPFSYFVHP